MTGYESKRAAAQDKYRAVKTYHEGKPVYVAQPAQEPVCPACKAEVLYECVACSSNNYPAQPAQEAVAWMNNKDFEPIRVRIMQEAYELADRNDSEGYNAIKVMCGDVQRMLPPQRPWLGLTPEEILDLFDATNVYGSKWVEFARALEAKLKDKNT